LRDYLIFTNLKGVTMFFNKADATVENKDQPQENIENKEGAETLTNEQAAEAVNSGEATIPADATVEAPAGDDSVVLGTDAQGNIIEKSPIDRPVAEDSGKVA
jgi:hypothetical protein